MTINRIKLVSAILQAQDENRQDVYRELLDVYHTLLEQESINDKFLWEFHYYEKLSGEAEKLLNSQ